MATARLTPYDIVSMWSAPFDETLAARLAERRGCTEAEIKAEWSSAKKRGQRLHRRMEAHISGTAPAAERPREATDIVEAALAALAAEVRGSCDHLATEQYTGEVEIAPGVTVSGRMDCLARRPGDPPRYHVHEWKMKARKIYDGRRMAAPFQALPDDSSTRELLQAAIYAHLVARSGRDVRGATVHWLDPEDGDVESVPVGEEIRRAAALMIRMAGERALA